MKAKKIVLKSNQVIGICSVVLLITGIAVGLGITRNSTESSQANQQVIANLQNSSEVSLAVDNSESAPVAIQTAGVKEITGEVFQQLAGLYPKSAKYITVPSVTAINNTNKTITAVVMVLTDNRSNEHDGLWMTALSLEPTQSLSISPMDWAQPRKNMLHKYIEQNGEVREDKSDPTINSPEMWLAGSSSDFSISIGMVEFSDGTRWMTQR
jgi:hypothetical protein